MTDHIAIQDVISRYSNAVTRRQWAAIAGTFAQDATWEVVGGPHPMKFIGAQIGPGLQAAIGMTSSLIQLITPSAIELHGDRADAHCNIHEFGEMLDGKSHFEASGTYDDILRKVHGEWRFVSRICTMLKFRLVSLDAS